ncbi:hypothetical protein CVT26_008576 [Gymnopilus dilepis]|uniref:Uncharacterized protein n=1 Tax=Gymnopilus dilepis TaxID=231916 RepID=A0A409XXV7_9AGAR|nr:hypothetical protein CVT26_008576 [Gymnopilus dilepis]
MHLPRPRLSYARVRSKHSRARFLVNHRRLTKAGPSTVSRYSQDGLLGVDSKLDKTMTLKSHDVGVFLAMPSIVSADKKRLEGRMDCRQLLCSPSADMMVTINAASYATAGKTGSNGTKFIQHGQWDSALSSSLTGVSPLLCFRLSPPRYALAPPETNKCATAAVNLLHMCLLETPILILMLAPPSPTSPVHTIVRFPYLSYEL